MKTVIMTKIVMPPIDNTVIRIPYGNPSSPFPFNGASFMRWA